jgi:hypothetical protein
MKYESRQFFKEHEHDDVKGFTVLQAKDGKYHIAEKWLASSDSEADREDKWMNYWVPESDLLPRVESGDCEPAATLSDDQFEGVCKMVGWRYDTGEAQVEA